jgi:membrane-bound lytic murein transglycosylase D
MTRAGRFSFAFLFLFAFGCAHKMPAPSATATNPKEVESFRLSDPEPPEVVDQELESIPPEMTPRVDQWVQYFQGKGRPHMERYLARSTRYMTLMKRILRQNGLPEDLIYIALIESGFSSRATSRAAAVGYWQFIKGTGKRYGLEINSLVDERRDPVLSTQAAAEYFKGLYSVFGSWYLAMASYNVGENRVKREVMKHYTRDFWELARKRRFPKETVNYVPKFIAAKMIAKNPAKYGFTDIEYEKPIEFEMVKVDKPLNLRMMASKMNLEYEDFKQLNPKFRGEIAPVKDNGVLELRVPVGQTTVAMNAARESFVDRVELIADAGDTTTYKIRPGDSLYSIARRYRTSVSVLRDINDLKPGRKLRIGMRIQVPERSTRKAKVVVARREAEKADDQEKATNPEVVKNGVTYYIVQPGDTLSAIADDYDSSIAQIRKMNKLGSRAILKVGMRLRVPKDEGLPSDPGEARVAAARESAGVDGAHVVRAGENLTTIAKKYGISIQALRKANNLGNRSVLRAGAKLIIPQDQEKNPGGLEGGARRPANSDHRIVLKRQPSTAKRRPHRVHVVRRGENLSAIAARYNVSLDSIRERNRLGSRSKVLVGARLLIPNAEAGE